MNIYVANLNYRLNDEDLHQLFSEFGQVTSAKIIKDHETGRSRGFGFVEMPNEEEGLKALENLNGSEVDGKQLTVNEARPKQPNNNFRGGGNSRGGGYGPRRY
ncbi:RNA-binding protein [Chitinophaga caeni]|uniref:RNA-binding protein n=1 Tax=Chitinophaga caeni TaxID=2029983 RepID=A0A291QVV7_9BACT|nr:RNA-binding protein [Chitinophaga caeni]ATL47984.1 RNA-binding protein [Chitinophaga caeni]